MPTLAATQANPAIRDFYNRLIEQGQPHKKAMTAAMAKLLRIAYSVLITKKKFDPKYEENLKKETPGKF